MNRKTTTPSSTNLEWTTETAMRHIAHILEKRVSWDIAFQQIFLFLSSIVHVKCDKCDERLFIHVMKQLTDMAIEEPYLTPRGYARGLKQSLAEQQTLRDSVAHLGSLIGLFVDHESLGDMQEWEEIFGNKK